MDRETYDKQCFQQKIIFEVGEKPNRQKEQFIILSLVYDKKL